MSRKLSLAMALKSLVGALVLVGVTGIVASRVVSDDKTPPPGQQQPSKEEAEMQRKMMEAGTPGQHHKYLEPFVGEWDAESKFWMGPGEPMVAKATATTKWIMGGRFIEMDYHGDFQGMAFIGRATTGYDNTLKRFNSTWLDNMSTTMFYSTGTDADSGRTLTFTGEAPCCMTGEIKKHKSVWKSLSKDKHVFEMFEEGKDGKSTKQMEITYTRRTAA
ncbi:MAG TPA: DUF1579 domain-containing protein [Phycisphaerae bacterium]|nr:DUF1579 domain-containing protein [Phycisphaerae bacterium]